MEATYSNFDFKNTIERVPEILNNTDNNYEDKDAIPTRSSLTYDNGFYVNASVLFVDLRDSSSLSKSHKRPTLAKIYRTYISETIAVMRGNPNIKEIYIEGDGVWGVFETPKKSDIDSVFSTSAEISSVIDILNIFYKRNKYSEIKAGIGMSYGESLIIKAGYKGSGIQEVVWLGKVVGESAHLSAYGNKTYSDYETMVSDVFYQNLNDHNKGLLVKNYNRNCWHGNIHNVPMNNWVKENEK